MVRLTGLEPTRRYDTSTSSWPVYQFQHSRKFACPRKRLLDYYSQNFSDCQHLISNFSKIPGQGRLSGNSVKIYRCSMGV